MLQAKIFKCDEIAVNGQSITIAQLTTAVNGFNATQSCHLVLFDEYPGRTPVIHLDRVAATARLDMDGQNVIATINLMDTPMGKIASWLHESGLGLQVVPATSISAYSDFWQAPITNTPIDNPNHTSVFTR